MGWTVHPVIKIQSVRLLVWIYSDFTHQAAVKDTFYAIKVFHLQECAPTIPVEGGWVCSDEEQSVLKY